MTQKRKDELYDQMFSWICEHIPNDKDLFLTLTGVLGMTKEELHEHCIESLDQYFPETVISSSDLKRLADYAIGEGVENTEDGHWAVTYDELFYHFGVNVSDTNENGKLLEKELRQREEINELIMTEDCIEMTYHLEYCENCQGDPASLLSVLGCNLTEDHFDHGPVQSM